MRTAVAISGAAANPDSGVAGKGLTKNVVISLLVIEIFHSPWPMVKMRMEMSTLRLGVGATTNRRSYSAKRFVT
ncbi:MAG: hypothetical protein GY820_27295 [Gammaproteobacteria bacterium]|nr:hypothetical protein [Gammaproteobacteria bacterium]